MGLVDLMNKAFGKECDSCGECLPSGTMIRVDGMTVCLECAKDYIDLVESDCHEI